MLRLHSFAGLWIADLAVDADAAPRPRALALLALLAAAEGKGLTRDRVLGILWPDSDPEHARHALSQTLYGLRRALGTEVVLSTPELQLEPSRISSDVADFRAAVQDKRWADAAALYVGPFLDGFYLEDAPDFEQWVETERASLAASGIRAIEFLANEATTAGSADAVEHWRRLTTLDPFNARFARAYMEGLEARGDRGAALAHGKLFTERMRQEFDAQPDRHVERVMARLRAPAISGPVVLPVTAAIEVPAPGGTETPAQSIESDERDHRRRRVLIFVAVALLMLSAVTANGWHSARNRDTARPVLAVGRIRDLVAPESTAVSGVLSEMLATSLGRVNTLRVVANSRMLELTPKNADTSRTAVIDAARRAGADEIIEGELLPVADSIRLELRRVDIRTGLVRGAYATTGVERIALFDRAMVLVAADFRVEAPPGSLAEVSTPSPIAYRLYEEGLRAFYQFDGVTASRLFRAAVREDTLFPMATYYAWRSAMLVGDSAQWHLADRVLALSSRASPRDRLLMVTHVRATRGDPLAPAMADTLATNYPHDPEALMRAAEVIWELPRASQLLNQAVALDSAAGVAPAAICRLCDALSLLEQRYAWADSSAAFERTLKRWQSLRPRDAGPWCALADWTVGFGRRPEAEAALRHCELLGGSGNSHLTNLVWSLRSDDVEAANTQCAADLSTEDEDDFQHFRWYCTIALRMQGRYREAIALALKGRAPQSTVNRPSKFEDRTNKAILELETGHASLAAGDFRSMYDSTADGVLIPEGIRARNTTWLMTLAATAAIEAGDTTRARLLADSIEVNGRKSLFGRDPRLHHFVRGLLLSRAGLHAPAVQEFRNAMHSPTFGYTRINYELARSLLALGRPSEGIGLLQAALHGGIEGANFYVTRTELHELLARLFDAAGQTDSARQHYATVERALRFADPEARPRYETARQWLDQRRLR